MSLSRAQNYQNSYLNNDVFCYESWCSQRVLKKGKYDERESLLKN